MATSREVWVLEDSNGNPRDISLSRARAQPTIAKVQKGFALRRYVPDAAETKLSRLLSLGDQLANLAYNLAQSDRLDERTRECLDSTRRAWDAARKDGE